MRKLVLWFLGALFALLLTGCESDSATQTADSSVPWSRPAQWEGGMGMGSSMPGGYGPSSSGYNR